MEVRGILPRARAACEVETAPLSKDSYDEYGACDAHAACSRARVVAVRCDDMARSTRGQATVEMAIAFPVVIIVAVIAINATLFFSDCATFDRAFRQSVRTFACSPAFGQGLSQSSAQIEQALDAALDQSYLSIRVAVSSAGLGHVKFTGTLDCAPHLFGRDLRSEVFGVSLPHIRHTTSLVVDVYKPGVLF